MIYLSTYFDKNYLSRGLVLYDSLKEHTSSFELYVLCLDEETLKYFVSRAGEYPEIVTLSLDDIEGSDRELRACKSTRSQIEYYFTISPCLPLYILKKYQPPHICSLDADIVFFSSPQALFDLSTYSIVITPHKFSKEIEELVEYGIYNVSFQIFKNDDTGLTCLEKWRKQCVEWCYDQLDKENNRYADQKYLDEWNTLYPGKVKALYDNGTGLAPWNMNNYTLSNEGGTFYSNGEKLIFYHFHSFKILATNWAAHSFYKYKVHKSAILDKLYLHYWRKVEAYNLSLGVGKDKTKRTDFSKSLSVQLYYSIYVYFKLLNKRLLHIDYSKIPGILKKLIAKIYG